MPVPLTVAVNGCVCEAYSVAVGGLTETVIGLSVTVALPDLVGSAVLVAVTVTVCCVDTETGAVYKPPVVMLPTPAGMMLQLTC